MRVNILAVPVAAMCLGLVTATPTQATDTVVSYGVNSSAQSPTEFDLQSHRGGRGQWTESSLYAFSRSMELGVTTLELDTHLTQDNVVLVWHDSTADPVKCKDTGPATPGDPEFPYVGDRIRDLTLEQVKTLDCGYQQMPGYPQQEVVHGNRIATLKEVFALSCEHDAHQTIRWNIESKIEDPAQETERNALVDAIVKDIYTHGWPANTQFQSFDWAALDRVAQTAPDLELVALAEAENPAGGGLSPQEVADRGYDVWSPEHVLLTETNIAQAHALGLRVVPWTVNNPDEMNRLIDWGVDGLITDYPWQLRQVMAARGMQLPTAYPSVR